MKLLKNNRGATAVEFALVALPVFTLIFGVMQTAWVVWVDNLLHASVDTAARCGAVNSMTSPCKGSGSTNMINTAKLVFQPVSNAATFTDNSNTSSCGGSGLNGSYNVSIGIGSLAVNITETAKSCYPPVPVPLP
jgi:Flp pilus assembly protein TadG